MGCYGQPTRHEPVELIVASHRYRSGFSMGLSEEYEFK
jgi:hypothetical protein